MTKVGLHITDKLTFETWELAGHRLSGIVDSSTWCLGDWLVYGKSSFPDRYHRAIRAAGLQYQTLRNYAWVSRRFPLERRRAQLSFQHHAEVASLPIEKQDLWLDRAVASTWTTKQLRTQIRQAQHATPTAKKVDKAVALLPAISLEGSRLPSWRKAAEYQGIDFDQWVITTLDRAAERALEALPSRN
ncbi:hypothetical protein D5S18_27445 [Nocardia panacis]|uniref:Antibiotic biosynthesis protein n=2 Tax=Nocardia panacis TaxID=2340916 RepID=A0A3A4KDS1_9NOCA|nr:hypothetical protein D5S18_27445 [Nocardia panacis]